MDKTVSMPVNWNDAKEWEEYYDCKYLRGDFFDPNDRPSSIPISAYPQLAIDLLSDDGRNVWVPGCGFSPIPKLLSQLGLTVYATDISCTAIQFQASNHNNISSFITEIGKDELKAGELIVESQDFHQPYKQEFFDLIINIKAFQGFSFDSMQQIATTHYQALKPHRLAYFDTMNVQGEKREQLEQSLVEAGFFIPFYKLTKAYRTELNATNIPYVFILGLPHIPRYGVYAQDLKKWKTDEQKLRDIFNKYEENKKAIVEEEKQCMKKHPKQAYIIYSTG